MRAVMPFEPPSLVPLGYNTLLVQCHREAQGWVHRASGQKGVGEWTIQAAGYSWLAYVTPEGWKLAMVLADMLPQEHWP